MLNITIPSELITMLRARRVIPFLGAGFSAPLNLPDWDSMLGRLADEIASPLPHAEVKKLCDNNPLQVAEYYLLLCDKSIGPIRHAISNALRTTENPVHSGSHVELVNLGAPQIYTTNYDDLIEGTYKALKIPVEVVALPKHVATSLGSKTQIVKYHGDLRHENTLVLAESTYYARLDFESPMDLKFRSDLLGRSVLFMGYSFQDVNIRVIWFKLMRMMKDIRPEDRSTSYIVRFTPNPVLERLYEDVGIKTIVLDPQGEASTSASKSELMSEFMLELSMQVSDDGKIPGQSQLQFVSRALLRRTLATVKAEKIEWGVPLGPGIDHKAIRAFGLRNGIPMELKSETLAVLGECAAKAEILASVGLVNAMLNYAMQYGADPIITFLTARLLGRKSGREILFEDSTPWKVLWGAKLTSPQAKSLLSAFEKEFQSHHHFADHDLAYLADVLHRIISGEMFDGLENNIVSSARKMLQDASEMYPSILEHSPRIGEKPDVTEITEEIDRKSEEESEQEEEGDDVTF